MRGVIKLLDLPQKYLWAVIITFCMVGTYAVQNSAFDVGLMLVFGLLGLALRRNGFPAGPLVLGLILGPLAESNIRRAFLIDGAASIYTSGIAVALLVLSALAVLGPYIRTGLKKGLRRGAEERVDA
jgi:putative tricarboxylic transport membrane protein